MTMALAGKVKTALDETRTLILGAQILLGFQLVIVRSSTFEKLPASSRFVRGFALLAIAVTVVLLVTPPALHRIVWAGEESEAVLGTGSRITILALLPLSLGFPRSSDLEDRNSIRLAAIDQAEPIGISALRPWIVGGPDRSTTAQRPHTHPYRPSGT
jgi:hypothetical protein